MSRPKFRSRAAREAGELGVLDAGSPWDPESIWHSAALTNVRALLPPNFDIDKAVGIRYGRLCYVEYLRRTGGNLRTVVTDVSLMWTCCAREDMLPEVHYDRHGKIRPEDEAIVKSLAYYHRCDA